MSTGLTMTDAITALIEQKRSVGYKYAAEARVLARFAAFCRSEFPALAVPDQASVEAWLSAARRRAVTPATLQGLAAPVRELARWLGRRGVPAYVLPNGALPRPARYVPHIYTDQELAALFAQTDRCRYCSQVPFRHLVMPVLFRTIYACGLRASEARLLRLDDVDLAAGALQIRDAKGGKDRQTPVSAPLHTRLAGYHAQVVGHSGGDWFFPGTGGQPLTIGNIDKNFRRFLWQARISHGGRGHGPRVHDLRHTFAVNNLRDWFARGEDVALDRCAAPGTRQRPDQPRTHPRGDHRQLPGTRMRTWPPDRRPPASTPRWPAHADFSGPARSARPADLTWLLYGSRWYAPKPTDMGLTGTDVLWVGGAVCRGGDPACVGPRYQAGF